MARSGFEEVDHTADWALKAKGSDLADLCRQAALGMLQLAGVEAAPDPTSPWDVDLPATDAESLLVRWLEEVLFRIEARSQAPQDMSLHVEGARLRGTVMLGPLLHLGKAIKGVTYHGLQVRCSAGGCEATIVFDV